MGTIWRTAILLMATLAAVQMAAVPTQDTMVITRSDVSTPASESATELTTDEPNAPIQLTEMEVKSDISLRYAHTAVVTHVKNPAKKAQEATFRVLLPETAFISGFVMTIDGKSYKAYVKGKEDAKQVYTEAVSHGFGAALIGAKARDSNHFTVSVNVEPKSVAIFNLTYEELLVRRNGVYNHAINLHPGNLVPKLNVVVQIKETEKITDLRVPEVRTGNEIDASPEDDQNTRAVIKRTHDDREAIITFSPDLDEQKRLMDVYAAKTKESQNFHGSYSYYNNKQEDKTGVLGQFVVQYDVERPKNGEVLVNDGYFVHVYAPADLPPLNKHVVFVLDTSGSMSGHKIEQLHEAMKAILSELNKGDYFSIVEFSNGVLVHNLDEADKDIPANRYQSIAAAYESENKEPELVPPYPATEANVAKAKIIAQRLTAAGGTNIDKALEVAIKLIKKGIDSTPKQNKTEKSVPDTTSSPITEGKLEPIIIFLTDGEPTVGESNPTRIINRITEKNFGDSKTSIFSLAFGEDADRSFLRKLSLRNAGFMRHIYEAADAALQLRHFYREVASPLLSHVNFVYPEQQVKEVTKTKYRTIYAGSEVVVAGQYVEAQGQTFKPEVAAFCGGSDAPSGKRKFDIVPRLTPVSKKELPLERLWAYLTIKQLLDERDALDEQDDKKGPGKKALDIALKYEFVTPLTSLVVVKPNATNSAVDAESVDKESLPPPMYAMQGPPGMSSGQFGYHSGSGGLALRAAFRPQFLQPQYGSFMHRPAYSMSSSSALFAAQQLSLDYSLASAASAMAAGNAGGFQTISTTPLPDPLVQWKLESYSWAVPAINNTFGTLDVNTANGTVSLKLNTETEVPKETRDEDCARTHEGETGQCVYLTRCELAADFTLKNYEETHCSVKGFAGVCCPKTKIDVKQTR